MYCVRETLVVRGRISCVLCDLAAFFLSFIDTVLDTFSLWTCYGILRLTKVEDRWVWKSDVIRLSNVTMMACVDSRWPPYEPPGDYFLKPSRPPMHFPRTHEYNPYQQQGSVLYLKYKLKNRQNLLLGHELFRSISSDCSCDLCSDYENDLNPRQTFEPEGRSFTVLFLCSFFGFNWVTSFCFGFNNWSINRESLALTMLHNNHLLLHYELFSSFRKHDQLERCNELSEFPREGRFFLLINVDSLHDKCSLFKFMMPNGMTTFEHGQFSIKREYYLIVCLLWHYNLLLRIIYHYFCVLLKFILSNRLDDKLIQTFCIKWKYLREICIKITLV